MGYEPPKLGASFFDRYRLAALIQALEDDLRTFIRTHIAPFVEAQQLIGPKEEELIRRAEAEGVFGASPDTLVDYLDFGDAFALLNRHGEMLPDGLRRVIRASTPAFETAVPIRNRIMHGRPLRTDDEEHVVRLAQSVIDANCGFAQTSAVARHLEDDPSWGPSIEISTATPGGVLHNLPLPEFDETGLLGRDEELREVNGLLSRRRFPVTTIAGEGGIGKTALAVQALYDLVDSPDCPFEAVLWTSLKTERLTGRGIEEIRDSALDLVSVTGDLTAGVASNEGETGIDVLAEVLAGVDTLIAVDNIENIGADEIRDLIDALPDATFLLTSRVGLGEIERRIALGALSPPAAKKMLRQLAHRRGLRQIAQLTDQQATQVTDRLRRSPLAIRWFLEAVQAGGQPDDLLRDQSAVLQFCMSTIYDSLGSGARRLVDSLLALDGPATIGQLALLVGIERDEAQEEIYELQRRAIVNVEGRLTETLSQTYALAGMARDYLQMFGALDSSYADSVTRQLREIAASDEVARAEITTLEPHAVIADSPEERAVANVLRQALQLSRNGDLAGARQLIDRARDAVPGYFESYRVAALIESQARPEEARRLYTEAYRLAPSDHKPVVAYWLAGHLVMNLLSPEEAEPYAAEANEALALPRTALRLGQILMYQRRYDDAEPLLLQAAETGTGRGRVIAETVLLDHAKRVVELRQSESQPGHALEAACKALHRAWGCVATGVVDRRLFEAIGELTGEALFVMLRLDDIGLLENDVVAMLAEVSENASALSRPTILPLWEARFQRFAERTDLPDGVNRIVGDIAGTIESRSELTDAGISRGEILEFSSKKNYGFIRADSGEDIFFHTTGIPAQEDRLLLVRGADVQFRETEEERDGETRRRAVDVRTAITEDSRARALQNRRGIIVRVDREYAFLEDIPTQERIYVNREAFRDPRAWTRLNAGATVDYDAGFNARGAYALPGSASATPAGH